MSNWGEASRGRPAGRLFAVPRPLPRWVGVGLGVAAALLGPWTVWIVWTLPNRHLADHWALAWGGFDVGLACALAATAVSVLRRAWWMQVSASVAATMLISDAWFDVLTARGRMTVTLAVVEALAGELPLAAVCFWLAFNVEKLPPERAAEQGPVEA
jgi:hypothetical protein